VFVGWFECWFGEFSGWDWFGGDGMSYRLLVSVARVDSSPLPEGAILVHESLADAAWWADLIVANSRPHVCLVTIVSSESAESARRRLGDGRPEA